MRSSSAVEKTPRAQKPTEAKSETIINVKTPSSKQRGAFYVLTLIFFVAELFAKPQPRPARASIMASATRTPLRSMPEPQLLERKKTSDSEFVERLSKSNAT